MPDDRNALDVHVADQLSRRRRYQDFGWVDMVGSIDHQLRTIGVIVEVEERRTMFGNIRRKVTWRLMRPEELVGLREEQKHA